VAGHRRWMDSGSGHDVRSAHELSGAPVPCTRYGRRQVLD
jgi:hypothetical protein